MKRLTPLLLLLSFLPLRAQSVPNYARMLSGVNPQTGTSYSLQPIDTTRITSFANASPVAVCLSSTVSLCSGVPTAQNGFYGAGAIFSVQNIGPGTVTVTCQGCLIFGNGSASTVTLTAGQGGDFYSGGVNYTLQSGVGTGGTGAVLQNPHASQNIVQPAGTDFTTNLLSNIVYVVPSDNWAQTPSGSLSVGANTVSLTPCPRGLTVPIVTATFYAYVYISGVGMPEAAQITSTTCTQAGGVNGTITFTAANSHGAGYTIGSASQGVQEAIDAAPALLFSYAQNGKVVVGPYFYTWRAPVFVLTPNTTVDFSGSSITCPMSTSCLVVGSTANPTFVWDVTIDHFAGQPACSNCNFPMIEDSAQHTHFYDVRAISPNPVGTITSGNSFGSLIQVDNDQAAVIDSLSTATRWMHCDTTFCSVAVKGAGGGGNAGLMYIKNSNMGLNCGANGVDNQNANTLRISDSVIQAQAEFAVRSSANFTVIPNVELDNVYGEVAECAASGNPWGTGQAGLIVENGFANVRSSVGPIGNSPVFASTGSTQYNYYIVEHCSGSACGGGLVSAPFLAGIALTNGSGSIPVVWPRIGGTGSSTGTTFTYDVIRTSGLANEPAPYTAVCGGGSTTTCGSVATGLTTGSACATVGSAHICSFSDTASTNTTSYTVTSPPTYFPALGDGSGAGVFWPGSVVMTLGADAVSSSSPASGVHFDRLGDNVSQAINPVNQLVSSWGGLIPKFFAQQCPNNAGGAWLSCLETDNAQTAPGATLLDEGFPGGAVNGLKGRLIFEQGPIAGGIISSHKITLVDSNPAKTLATAGLRPTNDANDTWVGLDNPSNVVPSLAQLSFGAPVSISHYIGNVGDNTSYLERLTATLKKFNVSVSITGNLTVSSLTQNSFIYPGSGGLLSILTPASTPAGVPQVPVYPASGPPTLQLPGIIGRAITGTTSTDTIVSTDCNPNRVEYVGSVAVAVALPTATTLGVPNCVFKLVNNTTGSATALTITPTTWTINGNATLLLAQNQMATIYVDPNSSTNWDADVQEQPYTAGSSITITRTSGVTTLAATGTLPSGTQGLAARNTTGSTTYAATSLAGGIDASVFLTGSIGTCTPGTNDNICIANAIASIPGSPASSGGYAVIDATNMPSSQVWTASPFAALLSNGTTNFTSPQKCGRLLLSGGSNISMNQTFVRPPCWDVEVVSIRGSVQNIQPSSSWPAIYTTGTVTTAAPTNISTGQWQFVVTGSGTSFLSNVSVGEEFTVCQGTNNPGANGPSCGGNGTTTCSVTCGSNAAGALTFGMVIAVTSNTSLVIATNSSTHGTANAGGVNYVIKAPLVWLGAMGATGGEPGGVSASWRGGTLSCLNKPGCTGFSNFSEQENLSVQDVVINSVIDTYVDVESNGSVNSGPYDRIVMNSSSSCSAATMAIINRNASGATRPFEHWTINFDSGSSTCSAVAIDWENAGELWDGHYENSGNTTGTNIFVSVGTNAGNVALVTCPVVCVEPINSAFGAYIHGTNVTGSGGTGINIGSTPNANLLLEDVQSNFTNNFVDNARSCTVAATGNDTAIGVYWRANTAWFGTAKIAACASGGLFVGTETANNFVSTVTTGTAPLTVASTTNVPNLNASSLNGATFASPGPIGSTAASTGAFTSLSATSLFNGANTVRLTADSSGITATTPGTTFLTLPTLTASKNYSFTCEILYSQATAAVLDGLSVQAATNAATDWDAWGTMYTTDPITTTVVGSQGSALRVTSTTATPIVTATPAATGTVYQARIAGNIQVGASVPTMNILAFTGNASDAVTIKAGSFCTVAP